MSLETKVLIICYSFPPHPGIGGRRWAKFAKYLAAKNYKSEVFTAVNIFSEESLWTADVELKNITVHSHRFSFQKIFKNPVGFFEKVTRKILNYFTSFTKYTPEIITSFPNKAFWKKIENKLKSEQIKKVIVSGDPYLFYYAARLKEKIGFDLILDYRDLWNDHSFYKKNVRLTKKQSDFFGYVENYAVNHCNKIIFVDNGLLNTVSKRINNKNIKLYIIHNGFDPDDASHLTKNGEVKSEKIRLFFSGGISSDMNNRLYNFVSAYAQLKKSDPAIYNLFELHIYGTVDQVLQDKIKALGLESLKVNSRYFSKEEYYKMVNEYEIGMILVSDEYKDSFATKFSDYIHLNKFIITIAPVGAFSEFITANNLGMAFFDSYSPEFFVKLANNYQIYKGAEKKILDSFKLDHLTDQLVEVIKD